MGIFFWFTKYFIYAGNESVTLKQGKELFWNYSGLPGWYLFVLLFIKVIDCIFDRFIHNNKVKIVIWMIMFISGGFIDIYLISIVMKFGIYYQIGKAVRNISFIDNPVINCKNCIALLCLTTIFRFANDLNYVMDFGIAISSSFLVILLYFQTNKHSFIMETIGESSMVPYVLHAYMTIPVRIVLQRCNCQDFAVFVIAETGVAIFASMAIIKCMKRFKWIQYLFYPGKLLYRYFKTDT